MNNYLGKNIATQRHAARMTQEQLAQLSDMTINCLSKIERGVVKQIGAGSLYRIAKALNVSMESLVEGTTEAAPAVSPQRQLLNQQLDRLDPIQSDEYSRLFFDLLKVAERPTDQ